MRPAIDIPKVANQDKETQDEEFKDAKEEVPTPQVLSNDSLLMKILKMTFHLA